MKLKPKYIIGKYGDKYLIKIRTLLFFHDYVTCEDKEKPIEDGLYEWYIPKFDTEQDAITQIEKWNGKRVVARQPKKSKSGKPKFVPLYFLDEVNQRTEYKK